MNEECDGFVSCMAFWAHASQLQRTGLAFV